MKKHLFLAGFHAHQGSMSYVDALNFALELGIDSSDISAFIKNLMHMGLINGDASAYGTLHLTHAGRIFLLEAQDNLQEIERHKVEENAAQKSDRKFQIKHSIFTTLFGFLLGLIADNFTSIIELLIKIIKQFINYIH
jgi:predicted transcriptional regulator